LTYHLSRAKRGGKLAVAPPRAPPSPVARGPARDVESRRKRVKAAAKYRRRAPPRSGAAPAMISKRGERAMKGGKPVLDTLQKLLTNELTATDVYLVQGRTLENQGYLRLAERLSHESEEERGHADAILRRLIFLEATPDMHARDPFPQPADPVELLTLDLALEIKTRDMLRAGIKVCFDAGDHVSRHVLEQQLEETESDHLFWLEQQVRLADALGKQAWLAEQLKTDDGGASAT
jgi:bacterioferritin